MFLKNLKEEDIIMQTIVTRPVENKEVIANLVGNLLTPAGGDIAAKVKLILTKDIFYIVYIGHCSIGYAEEIRNVEEIKLDDIKVFDVTSADLEEKIQIETEKEKYTFTREDPNEDNVALAMSKIIQELKKG